MRPMRLAPYLLCLGLGSPALFACCSSTPSEVTAVVRPELVAVTPEDFLGSIACAPASDRDVAADASADLRPDPNAARSYVATLFDVTPSSDGGVPDPGTSLPSSPPTSCLTAVTFRGRGRWPSLPGADRRLSRRPTGSHRRSAPVLGCCSMRRAPAPWHAGRHLRRLPAEPVRRRQRRRLGGGRRHRRRGAATRGRLLFGDHPNPAQLRPGSTRC